MKPIYVDIAKKLGIPKPPVKASVIQTLWGGYGELVRLHFEGYPNVIVKHVCLPDKTEHPKGWNTKLSHQRKVRSYQVETAWYQHYTQQPDPQCPMPKGLLCEQSDKEWLIVMEDLAEVGFIDTHAEADFTIIDSCLRWLANFHAKNIENPGAGLWEQGTYWHLATRPDELASMTDVALQAQADRIDEILQTAPYQTLVHGDAKLANFCFSEDGTQAAAVDFQYVGRGCAMKDVALFMSSAIPPGECEAQEHRLLECYFGHLEVALAQYRPDIEFKLLAQVWRPLFYIAWADFHRFVKGWSPEHWKINPYTEQLTQQVILNLK
ncbi:aminoglycoside phosphotransferase family protein [Vibrio profundi]|uniref:aminoglycoside phosphotransferase family protein n=1 Tax=Vibrio profundi TaxID=1774960 RepID=UPI00373571E8